HTRWPRDWSSDVCSSDLGGAYNRFKTFTEELRFQGHAFGNLLDWLVGGYYADEKLQVRDNLSYGADYARFGNCLVAANFASSPRSEERRVGKECRARWGW